MSRVEAVLAALTDEQIEALRGEAIAAGDDLGASICNSALRGDANHRRAVAVMIADDIEARLISINAALAERAERLRSTDNWRLSAHDLGLEQAALKAQIRDLETEKHALLQELPL